MRVLRPTRAEATAALASAALFALAFPPFPFVLPAFGCLVPLAVAVARAADEGERAVSAARIGFWFGFAGYATNLYWIAVALSLFTKLAILGYVAALAWLSPFAAGAAWVLFVARRSTRWPLAILLPVAWTAHEVVLNYLSDLSFPWLPLGLAVARHPIVAEIADISSVRGVSFWIALTNGLLADAYLLRTSRLAVTARLAAVAAATVLVASYGAWRMRTLPLRSLAPVAVIQPNIPEDQKLRDRTQQQFITPLAALTRRAFATGDPKLVVWPETALPDFLASHPEWTDSLRTLANVEHTPILFGMIDLVWRAPGREKFDYYNAAAVTDSVGRVGTQAAYHKGYLVPIVERVPFLNPEWFSGIEYFGGFGRGVDPVPFATPIGKVGTLICYESIFPQLSRRYRREGADLLVNITNDAWFGRSTAPYQHHAHLVLRAIENRVGVVRSANTGISGYIDPLGRIVDETPLFVPAMRTYVPQTTSARTLYTRFGDWLGTACLMSVIALGGLEYGRRRGSRRRSPTQ